MAGSDCSLISNNSQAYSLQIAVNHEKVSQYIQSSGLRYETRASRNEAGILITRRRRSLGRYEGTPMFGGTV
jgi:hypothetical protein